MKKLIAALLMAIMTLQGVWVTMVFAEPNPSNVNLRTLSVNGGAIALEFNPEKQLYFVSGTSGFTEIFIEVVPQNSNATVTFGQIADNQGEFWSNAAQELMHTFTIAPSVSETRLLIKVVSPEGEKQKIYSLVLGGKNLSRVIPMSGSQYTPGLTVFAAGFGSAFIQIEKDGLQLAMGTIMEPNADIVNVIQDEIGENEKAKYVDICPYNSPTASKVPFNEKDAVDIFLRVTAPAPAVLGKNYKAFRIADGIAEQITIIDRSIEGISFETAKYGTYAIIYNPNAYSVVFYDDYGETNGGPFMHEYFSANDLAPGDLIPTPPTKPTKSGYAFSGWYTRQNGEGTKLEAGAKITSVSGGQAFYAYWVKKSSGSGGGGSSVYTVQFSTNGGSAVSSQSVRRGGKATKPIDPKKDGFTFAGWFTDTACTKEYDFDSAVNGGFALYAKWTAAVIGLKPGADKIHYIRGYKDGSFKPDIAITRYEMLSALDALLDIASVPKERQFLDAAPEYKEVVDLFSGAGIIQGYDDGEFKGDKGLTRAEFVKAMSGIMGVQPSQSKSDFADVNGHWAESCIADFTKLGYLKGYEDELFHPDSQITRAEFAAVVNRVIGNANAPLENIYSDLTEQHWAYSDIMKAREDK